MLRTRLNHRNRRMSTSPRMAQDGSKKARAAAKGVATSDQFASRTAAISPVRSSRTSRNFRESQGWAGGGEAGGEEAGQKLLHLQGKHGQPPRVNSSPAPQRPRSAAALLHTSLARAYGEWDRHDEASAFRLDIRWTRAENLGWFGKRFHGDMRADALSFNGGGVGWWHSSQAFFAIGLGIKAASLGRTSVARNSCERADARRQRLVEQT
jgi:hypothetical protein